MTNESSVPHVPVTLLASLGDALFAAQRGVWVDFYGAIERMAEAGVRSPMNWQLPLLDLRGVWAFDESGVSRQLREILFRPFSGEVWERTLDYCRRLRHRQCDQLRRDCNAAAEELVRFIDHAQAFKGADSDFAAVLSGRVQTVSYLRRQHDTERELLGRQPMPLPAVSEAIRMGLERLKAVA